MFDAHHADRGAVTVYAIFRVSEFDEWMAVVFPVAAEWNKELDEPLADRSVFRVVPLESLRPEWTS